MTEAEAKTKLCPFGYGHVIKGNHVEETTHNCHGSACLAWVNDTVLNGVQQGKCLMIERRFKL